MGLRHVGDARRAGSSDWWRTVGLDCGWGVDVVRALSLTPQCPYFADL